MAYNFPRNPKVVSQPAQPRYGRMDIGLEQVAEGIERATDWLLGLQHPDGYWCGELEADSMLESDYIFMHTLLGTGDRGKMERAVNEILRHQNEDGGWSIYPNGPSNISLGVKAYLALKLMGWSADHPVLVKAREWILANGGVTECNTFTKIYLCFTGPVRVRRGACGAAGDSSCFRTGATSISTRFQRGRARSGAALDHLCEEALQEASAGAGNR